MSLPWPYYILVDREVRPASDAQEWVGWFETHRDRHVAETFIGEYRVSTIFLATDFNFSGTGLPVLFESLVQWPNPEHVNASDGVTGGFEGFLYYRTQYHTYDQAEQGHEALCEQIRRLTENGGRVTVEILSALKLSNE